MSGLPPPPRRRRRLARLLFLDAFRIAPGWMSAVTVAVVVGSALVAVEPLGYRLVVDGVIDGAERRVVAGLVLAGASLALTWVLSAIESVDAAALGDRVLTTQTARLIELVAGVPHLEHLERPEYLAQVDSLRANSVQLTTAPRRLAVYGGNVARLVVLLGLLVSVSPWLLVIPLFSLPPLLANGYSTRLTRETEDRTVARVREARLWFDQAVDPEAAAELRCYGLAEEVQARHARHRAEIDRITRAGQRRILLVQGLAWFAYAAGMLGVIALAVGRGVSGAVTVGAVVMVIALVRRARREVTTNAQAGSALLATRVTADRLLWLEDHAARAEAAGGDAPAPAALRHGLTLRDVSFRYPGTERAVLEGVDLRFEPGSVVAVVGANGSGKSTLVKLLLGMYAPSTGAVLVDGQDLRDIEPEAWRARCTAAFQDFSRFQLRAVETIGVGDVAHAGEPGPAQGALDRGGFGGLTADLPDGLNTMLGTDFLGGYGLSGGQWQKLAVARMLRRDQPLLAVLDEPAASLDAQAEYDFFTHYASPRAPIDRSAGTLVVLVSHRLSSVRHADLIVMLEAGRVVESGTHEELLAAGGRYHELYSLQAAGYR